MDTTATQPTTEDLKEWSARFYSRRAEWRRGRSNPAYEDFEVSGLATSVIGAADRVILFSRQRIKALEAEKAQQTEEIRLLRAERDRARQQADGARNLAVGAHKSAEQQRNLLHGGNHED